MKRSPRRRFAYKLAVRLGILNVEKYILRGLTAEQFRAWEIYSELEPFDETRQDYRVASIVQMLYNINRGKNQEAKKIEEFVLKFGEQPEAKKKQTPQQQFNILKVLSAMHANDVPNVPQVTEGIGPPEASGLVSFDASVSPEMQAMLLEKARKAMN